MINVINYLYSMFINSVIALIAGFLWNLGAIRVGLPTLSMFTCVSWFWCAVLVITWFTRIVKNSWYIPVTIKNEKNLEQPLDKE